MKKKIIISLIAVLVATASYAQSTLVATLTHESAITMYYGTAALQAAYNAAVSGDVINLSGGSFLGVNITKAITIRGNGIDHAYPTIITAFTGSTGMSTGMTINVPSDDPNKFSVEGVRFTCTVTMNGDFENPSFVKCLFDKQFADKSGTAVKNALFANCKFTSSVGLYGLTAKFINCFVSNYAIWSPYTASGTFVNCVLLCSSNQISNCNNSQLINCIICNKNSSSAGSTFSTSSNGYNCVTVNYTNPFSNSQGAFVDCTSVSSYSTVFKDFTGTYSDEQTFELTDAAKSNYLGADDTQVGLYGGLLPYTSVPSYPTINTMNVAKKTTADGKLSVEIEVSAAE